MLIVIIFTSSNEIVLTSINKKLEIMPYSSSSNPVCPIMFKSENGAIVDAAGNVYEVRKHEWHSDYSALYVKGSNNSLLYWHEMPDSVQSLFK